MRMMARRISIAQSVFFVTTHARLESISRRLFKAHQLICIDELIKKKKMMRSREISKHGSIAANVLRLGEGGDFYHKC